MTAGPEQTPTDDAAAVARALAERLAPFNAKDHPYTIMCIVALLRDLRERIAGRLSGGGSNWAAVAVDVARHTALVRPADPAEEGTRWTAVCANCAAIAERGENDALDAYKPPAPPEPVAVTEADREAARAYYDAIGAAIPWDADDVATLARRFAEHRQRHGG